jgi:hypothetical protein
MKIKIWPMAILTFCLFFLQLSNVCEGSSFYYKAPVSVSSDKGLKIKVCYEGADAAQNLNAVEETHFSSREVFGFRSNFGWSMPTRVKKTAQLEAGAECFKFSIKFFRTGSFQIKVGLLFQDGQFLDLGTKFLDIE